VDAVAPVKAAVAPAATVATRLRARRPATAMLRRIVLGAMLPVLLVVCWDLLVRAHVFPSALVPAPMTVLRAMQDWAFGGHHRMFYSGKLPDDLTATLVRVLVGFGTASVAGVFLGTLIGVSRIAEELFTPLFRILGPVPPATWIPVAIVVLGLGQTTNYFLTFLGAVFPVISSCTVAVLGVNRDLLRAGRMMGRGRIGLVWSIVLPAALPGVVGGLRTALGLAWMMAVTSEMLAVHNGLGYMLWNAYSYLDYPGVFAAMIVTGLCGLATDTLLRLLTRTTLRWHTDTGVRG
jgi:NitT/TauT family transport system permease protein